MMDQKPWKSLTPEELEELRDEILRICHPAPDMTGVYYVDAPFPEFKNEGSVDIDRDPSSEFDFEGITAYIDAADQRRLLAMGFTRNIFRSMYHQEMTISDEFQREYLANGFPRDYFKPMFGHKMTISDVVQQDSLSPRMRDMRKGIIEKVGEALKNPSTLYSQNVFNRLSSVGGKRHTEIAAREILREQNLSTLCSIPTIHRKRSYKIEGHEKISHENAQREEDRIAKSMYGRTYRGIGKIIDFQTPLKDNQISVAEKIDLLSYNENEKKAYVLTLKKPGSTETLLRCVHEAYTYWKMADKKKLLHDFTLDGYELRKAVLVFENCAALADIEDDIECDAILKLMDKLDVDIFVLNEGYENVIRSHEHWRRIISSKRK